MPIKNILGETIGVTQMINKKNGIFTSEDEMILSSFSSQAAVAIEKSQLFKKTEDMRIYLQSILSSITSCVVTLSESMKLNTINRPWFAEALGFDETYMKENSAEKWLENNQDLLKDIRQVYQSKETLFVTEVEIKGSKSTVIVNYQVMPLIGANGVVLVLDDISSEKRAVMTLGRYMSPALAKQVMEDGSGQLGGKRKKVSILFSDIRSFTTLSEGMDPPEVVDMLNHHFTDAVNAITEEQGILDKFIGKPLSPNAVGDAVMAVFGVPFASPEDAIHACNTALKMRDALVVTNQARVEAGKCVIKIGIGVNTGMVTIGLAHNQVLSGNIGSIKRMEFSCIGDAVNLASRTEGLTKFYGIQILITEFTLEETGDLFLTREVDSVTVTGKKTCVKMFELLGRKGDNLDLDVLEGVRQYTIGLSLYKKREFESAMECFSLAIEHANDGPSKVLLERCKNRSGVLTECVFQILEKVDVALIAVKNTEHGLMLLWFKIKMDAVFSRFQFRFRNNYYCESAIAILERLSIVVRRSVPASQMEFSQLKPEIIERESEAKDSVPNDELLSSPKLSSLFGTQQLSIDGPSTWQSSLGESIWQSDPKNKPLLDPPAQPAAPESGTADTRESTVTWENNQDYVMDRVLNKRRSSSGDLEYLVSWLGFPSSHTTWRRYSGSEWSLEDVAKALAFEKSSIRPEDESSGEDMPFVFDLDSVSNQDLIGWIMRRDCHFENAIAKCINI
ncbi:hypothetical protein HDU91_000086 [Kappamyces sp. JEL0680]|nr:hypothetical protein HDU91_000086 [Kappamyces sp. JEL0680]